MKFNQTYQRQSFENLLKSTLFGDKYKKDYKSINIDRKTIFFDEKSCFILWKVFLDRDIYVLEMKQKSKKDPRITLTKDAFKIMENIWANYALVIFYSDDSKSYRLSLLTRKKIFWEKEESDPKRYSFLLWEWEKTKTPEKQLNKQIHNFKELFDTFDVEVVRKEFFNNYLDLYIRLYREVIKDVDFKNNLKTQKIDLVSFTKTLLWKIVFLYFIQKKGWLWVNSGWVYGQDGDKDFMRSLWNDFTSNEHKTVWEKTWFFYNDYLEHLFYEWLNKDNRDNDDINDYFNFKVPYLNGWLFKKDYENWNVNRAKISNDIFSNTEKTWILDIFDTYNFTIDEDDLYDKEVAVDPEMLGKIFEKMISISTENIDEILEEYNKNEISWKKKKLEIDNVLNKKLGAFYTPREIVHYMTKESLIAYLVNNLKWRKEENEEKIRKLFDFKEQFLVTKWEITEEIFDKLASIITEVDEILKKVKVLDPAIGSGAFPMWLLHEISSIRYYIYWVFYETFGVNTTEFKNESWKISMYKIKRDVIQNNIYWVDISAGAIDIARLRFWLSLVVDEEKPEPLPNFEFKFVCANTLIPLIDDKWIFDNIDEEKLREKVNKWYNTQSNKENKNDEWKDKIRKSIEEILQKWHSNIFASEKEKQLITFNPFESKTNAEFFDLNLMFWFRRWEKIGITIWNPPYIKEYDNKNAFDWLRDKPYYIWKMDLWYYFACYGLDLLKDWWIQSFIAQNNWITSFGAKKMRNKILEDAKIKEFIDFWDFKVFETAWIQTMIYILEKTKNNSKYEVKYSRIESKDFDRNNLDRFLYDTKNSDDYKKHYSKIEKSKYLDKTLDFVDDEKDIILEKILKNWTFKLTDKEVANWIHHHHWDVNKDRLEILGDNYKIWDWIFVLNNEEKEKLNLTDFERWLVKPDFSTEEIWRYFANSTNKKYVIYTDSSFKDISKIEDYPSIKKHLDKFKDVITSDNKPYWLHRARDEKFFIWEKIIAVRKCDKPAFSYVDFDSYVSATFYVIKTDRLNQKYLTWLLNSKLIEFWLKNKWKMQWNNYQLDKEPLVNIPIKQISLEDQKPFIEKVDKILEITKQPFYDPKNPSKEQKDLEDEIDKMVYELYGLSEEEVRVVEESLR